MVMPAPRVWAVVTGAHLGALSDRANLASDWFLLRRCSWAKIDSRIITLLELRRVESSHARKFEYLLCQKWLRLPPSVLPQIYRAERYTDLLSKLLLSKSTSST
jgi:hypothetical protein